jgi:phosphoserine phosphatase RsbU/P
MSETEMLEEQIRELRAQLDAKTRIATRAMATYQQRALLMEEHAAELRAANEEIRRVNSRLSETLQTLEERDRRITSDLEQARRFQQRILPSLPASKQACAAVLYRPAELVGGDVYDAWERSRGVFRFFLADATGHGVQAALRTMLLKAEYDRVKLEALTPEQALMSLNERLTAAYPGLEMQCTATCFDLITTGDGAARVRYATAAHPPLLVLHGSDVRSIYQPGPFIGVAPEIELEAVELEVGPGDRLLAYSDGLEEQLNANGVEFGIERVTRAVGDRSLSIEDAVARLIGEWETFLGTNRPDDDATLIAVENLR